MAISIIEHSAALTSKVVGTFNEIIPVKSGFSAWFPRETTPTLYVDVNVQRAGRRIAVDVLRFTEGNKNKASRETQHKYQPPFYREEYDFARDEIYQNTIMGGGVYTAAGANKMIASRALKAVTENRDAIERAIQLQQAQVMQTGIVTLKNGDNIDYRRKAESIVDVSAGAGEYWSNAASTPLANIAQAGLFLREVGNSSGNVINVIMRTSAMTAFLSTTQVKEQADFRRIDRINIGMPQFTESTGFTFYGQTAAGDFVVNLWTYNEIYEDADGNTQYYLDEGNVIVMPEDFTGKTVFGGLPTMNRGVVNGTETMMPAIVEAEFLLRGYYDEKTISSTLELSSAPIVIPFSIDKIYTMKVLA